MPKLVAPITKTQIESAKPRAEIYELSDGGGLSLAVLPSGTRSWRFKYPRPITKKRTKLTYGNYPAISAADARRLRDADKALLAKGIDPITHRQQNRAQQASAHANTFQLVAARWIEVKRSKVTESFTRDIWRSLELHVFPTLGSKPIHELSAPMVITALKPLEAKGTFETVKRINQRINEIMVWSVNTGLIDSNPLAGVGSAFLKPVKRKLPSVPPSQLPELLGRISNANVKTVTRRQIYWLLHTMVRPNEAAGTSWEEIDFDMRVWNVPWPRMKTKKPHVVPLSDQAMSILESMKAISGDKKFVFPSAIYPSKSIDRQTANAVLKRIGYSGKLVAHGFRSIASTYLNESGFNPDIIEAALAHVDANEVRAAYNRTDYLEQRRDLMNSWSNFIDRAMAAKPKTSLYE